MILFLDANALAQDPTCSGAVWHVLANAPDTWNVRLITSEIAVAEAVAGFGRRLSAEIAKIEKLAGPWGALGISEEANLLKEQLLKRQASYKDELESSLLAANVEVIAAPDAPHMELVSRSVARRRPCNDNGDGYRDTLIWLSILSLAVKNADQEIVLITNDSDFMSTDRDGFHADLIDDLVSVDANAQVRVSTNLADVTLELADSSPHEGDLRSLRSDLKDDTVRRFVAGLVAEQIDSEIDPRACGLPRLTKTAHIQELGPAEQFKYTFRGGVVKDEAVAEFSWEAPTRIILQVPEGVSPDEYEAILPVHADGNSFYLLSKPLIYTGIVRLGRYDRPLGGEVTKVSAQPDDPGRREWRVRASEAGHGTLSDVMKAVNSNYMRNVLKDVSISPMLKDVNTNYLRDALKNVNTNYMRDLFKNVNTNYMRDLFKNVNTSYLRNALKNLNTDTTLDSADVADQIVSEPDEERDGRASDEPESGAGDGMDGEGDKPTS